MTRTNLVLGGVAAASLALAGWMYLQNSGLEDDLAASRREVAVVTEQLGEAGDPWANGGAGAGPRSATIKPPADALAGGPTLPAQPRETVMQRRARMTEMMLAMFGRGADESEADYKARTNPLITAGLEKFRRLSGQRRHAAQDAAGVTREQSAKLDAEVQKIYGDVIDYTNGAISDGQVSPYSRNVAGWLQFAGGLGTILTDAESRFGKILSPEQLRTMTSMGFEWGEYLGSNAPWENLNAPPPPPGGGGS
jgi:hypothetical protein